MKAKSVLAIFFAVWISASVCWAATPVNWDRVVVDPNPGRDSLEKALADVKGHGNGKLDIILGFDTYVGPGGVYWYEYPASGNPHDPWIKHTILSGGGCYEHMQVLDLNGDGRPDIILSIDSSIKWLEHPGGDGTGTWIVHDITPGIGHEVRLADIDGDGKMDVITSRTRNIDFQNSPTNWTIVPWGQTEGGSACDGLGLLDIGSGLGAVNITAATSDGIFWFENPREHGGNARTDPWIAHRIGNNYGSDSGPSFACVDVNGDGRMDIITAPNEGTAGNGGLMWWEAPADRRSATWIPHSLDGSYEDVHWIEVADVNGDGIPDLIVTEEEQSARKRVAVFYNDGQGNFTQQVIETTGGQNQVAGDVNADGRIDFISVNHGVYGQPNPVELFLNLGSQTSGGGGNLRGSLGAAAASYNLTALGTSDWAAWGGEGSFGNFDHKAGGGGQISTVTTVGAGGNYGYWSDASRTTSWSDGTPTGSSSNHGYIWSNGALSTGFTFTVPAGTNTRTLNIYCGASNASATLTAHLSDNSAPDYIQSYTGPGAFLFTITYHAGAPNQTLTLTLLKTGNNPGFTNGSADLKAAWLGGGGSVESPFGGTPWPIPGTIQAENYDSGGEGIAYHDSTPGNTGGGYRNDGVDVRGCSDSGGGYQVGWTDGGEWLNYTVNVAANGTYSVTERIAAGVSGGALHVELDGSNLTGTVTVPNTGSWDTWQSLNQTIDLNAGQHVLRVFIENGGFDLNWISFAAKQAVVITSPASAAPNPATINQAVSFTVAAANAVSYSWNFGDGTGASGASVSHAYGAAGNYTATVSLSDGNGNTASSSIAVTVNGGGGGNLTGSLGAAAASYNLTALGTSDWADWGGEGKFANFDHKASGGGKITTVTTVGSGGNYGYWADSSRTTSWSDGTPTGSSSNHGYIWSNGALNTGFTFTVPADTTTRTLSIYCGASTASATLTAHLSDNSAPDYIQAYTGPGAFLFTITYQAGAANQTLTLTLLKTGNNPGFTDGSADLKAAWLAVTPAASALLSSSTAAIDLGSVKVNQTLKVKLPLPASIPAGSNVRTKATGLPHGLRLSGDNIVGRSKSAGTYTFTVQFMTKNMSAGVHDTRNVIRATQEYTLVVAP